VTRRSDNAPVIALVVAAARNDVIGERNRLPWRLPADLKHFKQITMGKPVVMGRKTFESIGRPLPGRANIVLTQSGDYTAPGCQVVHSVDQALAAAAGSDEVMVIGGGTLYAACLSRATRIYLTRIHHDFAGDARFPALDVRQWRETYRRDHAADDKNPYAYSFIVLERQEQ
jgi:dihydrofolate reductase